MEKHEIKIGVPVICWGMITDKGTKIDPRHTKISSEPWDLPDGETVCNLIGSRGGVSIKKLEKK